MNTFFSSQKQQFTAAGVAFLHLVITFFTDKIIFSAAPSAGIFDYSICKALTFVVLFFFYSNVYELIFSQERQNTQIYQIIKSALPYLLVLIIVLIIKLPNGYLSNDESLIYDAASNLEHYTWFYYLTTYYYIISLMLIPHMYGPIIIKIIIEFLVVGYVVFRIRNVFGAKLGRLSYLLFLLYPVIAYTTSAHRLPVYYLLYLVLITTLLFDYIEKKQIDYFSAFWLLFLGCVLTQWRTEGIYLAVLVPLLMLIVYKNLHTKKAALLLIAGSLLLQYLISIPQNGFTAANLDAAANDRMKPFYAYTITNMYRNGLDLEKNANDLAIVDRYLSLDAISAINDYYEDINYEDVLILYQEGYIGTREDATQQDFINYSNALKHLFVNNPGVFLKTRWGAFCYAALPFNITFSGLNLRALVGFGVSIVKSISYNLFIPLLLVILLCIYTLFRKRWFSFFVTGGLLAHWFIVFILAPASYFKYYFPVYIIAYFYLLLLILQYFYNRTHENKLRILC